MAANGNQGVGATFADLIAGGGELEGPRAIDGAAIEAGKMGVGLAVELGEPAADEDLAGADAVGGVGQDGIDDAVGALAGSEGRVHGAVVVQAAEAFARDAVEVEEGAGNEKFALTADEGFGQGKNGIVRARAGVKGGIERG